MKLKDCIEKLKDRWQDNGYTCDCCGAEVFDYPCPRFCEDCLATLNFNEGNVCQKCGRAVVTEGVCLLCKENAPTFEKGFSPLVYYDKTAELVNRLKRGRAYLALPFADWMKEKIQGCGYSPDNTIVTFVPLEKGKKRLRGYDQAEKLAARVAKLLDLPLVDVFVCIEKKMPQKELSVAARRKNVEGNYRVVDRKSIKGKEVILIDDIMTTGATGDECASRLQRAGAAKIYFLTAASLPERR